MPLASAGYSVGGFALNVGGQGLPLGTIPGFSFLPGLGGLPFGLNVNTEYQLADLNLQWLICDFGRRLGRYHQANLATDIAQLQSQRAYQTVANDVSVAYYQVLRSRALVKTARDAIRRATEDLDVAKKLAKGGVLEREKVLRAQVQLAENQRLLDTAEVAEVIAVAGLNLAIGLNVNAPTAIEERSDIPPFAPSLADCLQTAVAQRREFEVARRSVQVAVEGQQVARRTSPRRSSPMAPCSIFNNRQTAATRTWRWGSSSWNGPSLKGASEWLKSGRRIRNCGRQWPRRIQSPIRSHFKSRKLTVT